MLTFYPTTYDHRLSIQWIKPSDRHVAQLLLFWAGSGSIYFPNYWLCFLFIDLFRSSTVFVLPWKKTVFFLSWGSHSPASLPLVNCSANGLSSFVLWESLYLVMVRNWQLTRKRVHYFCVNIIRLFLKASLNLLCFDETKIDCAFDTAVCGRECS